ncbi:telomerase inhibitor [Plenodomus biglobosus]|nr:telomerase inhibitor [Plenodomus biglobosus]
MGLAAPKNRSKISNDPNNNTWANNTSRFGHRILAKQGWQQGDHLGAKDASHSAHYTAASASHIRVFLKDDNLGLGAKRGSERAENFGLAGLESILGRLNGNEAEVKKEEERREEIEKRAFVYRKYGMMNFVSGGLLVGDKIVSKADLKKEEPEVKVEIKKEPESDDNSTIKKEKKDKKRKRLEVEAVEVRTEEPKLKRKKKSLDLREEATDEVEDDAAASKKDRKSKKKSKKSSSDSEDLPSPASDPEALIDKARRKAEKKARKEEKKLKKALKKAAKAAKKSKEESGDSSSESEEESTPGSSVPATGTSTPATSTAGLTYTPRGMHAVRQRWIRQKKAATMDAQAMKEIFMIKTPS